MSEGKVRARNMRGGRGGGMRPKPPGRTGPAGARWDAGGFIDRLKNVPYIGGLWDETADWFGRLKATPLQAVVAVASGFTSLVTVFGIFKADSGGSSGGSRSGGFPLFDALSSGLGRLFGQILSTVPGQILMYFLVCATLGWTIATFGRWLTRMGTDGRLMFAHGITFLGGALVAVLASSVFSDRALQRPGIALFVLAGIALATYAVKSNFRLTGAAAPVTADRRAGLLLNFALSAIGLYFASKLLV